VLNASVDAQYLGGPAVGVGGTVGTGTSGAWTQGESVVVQLDRPLLGAGERVAVEIIDRETNSLVMDRTVRIRGSERFQFAPDAADGSTGAPAEWTPPNVSVDPNVTVPDTNTSGPSPDDGDSGDTRSGGAPATDSPNTDVPKDDGAGYVVEPGSGGGSVTIVHPDYTGDLPQRPNGEIVSPYADNIPIHDQLPPKARNDLGGDSGSGRHGNGGIVFDGGGGSSGSSGGSGGSSSGGSGGHVGVV
jgi:uncharacterized membrane protein YgcG